MTFLVITALASVVAGAIASVAGFGIGSVLTPLFILRYDVKLAVAAVAIPHVVCTVVRFWRLRGDLDPHVLRTFGLASAAGGLSGAVLQRYVPTTGVTYVLASLLIFVGIINLTGMSQRLRFGRATGWVAGALSGLLGGLVGNQGGIRSAGLLAYDVRPAAFVATATAVALIVDGVRLPVYLIADGAALRQMTPLIAAATIGGVVGTLAGEPILRRISPAVFRTLVGALLVLLGVYMFTR